MLKRSRPPINVNLPPRPSPLIVSRLPLIVERCCALQEGGRSHIGNTTPVSITPDLIPSSYDMVPDTSPIHSERDFLHFLLPGVCIKTRSFQINTFRNSVEAGGGVVRTPPCNLMMSPFIYYRGKLIVS